MLTTVSTNAHYLPLWVSVLGAISSFVGLLLAMAAGLRWLKKHLVDSLADALRPVITQITPNGGDSDHLGDVAQRTEGQIVALWRSFDAFRSETSSHWTETAAIAEEAKSHAAAAESAAASAATQIEALSEQLLRAEDANVVERERVHNREGAE